MKGLLCRLHDIRIVTKHQTTHEKKNKHITYMKTWLAIRKTYENKFNCLLNQTS